MQNYTQTDKKSYKKVKRFRKSKFYLKRNFSFLFEGEIQVKNKLPWITFLLFLIAV
jgi:hypothetical protein